MWSGVKTVRISRTHLASSDIQPSVFFAGFFFFSQARTLTTVKKKSKYLHKKETEKILVTSFTSSKNLQSFKKDCSGCMGWRFSSSNNFRSSPWSRLEGAGNSQSQITIYIYIYKTKNHSFLLLCMKNSSMRITSRMPKCFALNKNTLSDLATSGIITIYFSFWFNRSLSDYKNWTLI